MMIYLLKAIACLFILLLLHRLLLQREVMHRFNRFFLLFAVLASFLIPLLTIEVPAVVDEPTQVVSQEYLPEKISQKYVDATSVSNVTEETQFNWEYLFIVTYSLISLIFLFRFVRNIKILVDQIQRNVKVSYRGQTLVLLKEGSIPYSFLKYIFVAESDLENGKFTDAVFEHERTHVEEKHSWDILFIEGLMVPLWFHPGLYWAKESIKLNHEFIADEVALRSTSLEKYEGQLLAMLISGQKHGLASSLNFSLTKKRFEMMKRKSLSSKSWIKALVLVPVLGALIYFFSKKETAEAEPISTVSELYVNASKAELDEIDFDLTLQLNPNGAISFENKDYDQDQAKDFIKKRKANAENFNINLITSATTKMGDLGDFQSIIRDLDIRKIYYKYLNHDERNAKRTASDITAHYSIVHQDQLSRSKVDLLEEKEKYYQNASIFVEDESGELIPKSYNELTAIEKTFLHDPLKAPARSQPSSKVFESWKNPKDFALWLDGKIIPNSQLEQMSNSEIAFFFYSFVHLNARSERFPQEHQVHMYSGQGFEKEFGKEYAFETPMTKEDKFYIYPSARRTNVGKPWIRKVNKRVAEQENTDSSQRPGQVRLDRIKDQLQSYKAINLTYEKLRNQPPHFIKKTKAEQEKLLAIFSDLGSKYFQIEFTDKPKVNRPVHPFAPYLKLESNGEVYYKLLEDLTAEEKRQLPPPPTPANTKTQVVAYKNIFLQYELIRNEGRNNSYKSAEVREVMYTLHNELQDKFLDMA
jgi:beta-lactamase regulating signal transducer with metallopeptidase domain